MATCPNCGSEVRDGAWTCGFCGAPIGQAAAAAATPAGYDEPMHDAAYYNAPTIYGTAAPTMPTLSPYVPRRGAKLVALGVVLAVVAIVLAGGWFFFLRSTAPDFSGTWTGTGLPSSTSAASTESVTIKREGHGYLITLTSANGQTLGPVQGSVRGSRLETTLDYVGSDPQQRMATAFLKGFLAALVDDYKIVFYFKDGTLYAQGDGKPKSGVGATNYNTPARLTKAQ